MSTEVTPIEIVDLSDLDLLDDELAHARCTVCWPGDTTLVVIESLCGVRTIQQSQGDGQVRPPNACEKCQEMWDLNAPCPRCGAAW